MQDSLCNPGHSLNSLNNLCEPQAFPPLDSPKCLDYRCMQPYPADVFFFFSHSFFDYQLCDPLKRNFICHCTEDSVRHAKSLLIFIYQPLSYQHTLPVTSQVTNGFFNITVTFVEVNVFDGFKSFVPNVLSDAQIFSIFYQLKFTEVFSETSKENTNGKFRGFLLSRVLKEKQSHSDSSKSQHRRPSLTQPMPLFTLHHTAGGGHTTRPR